MGRNAIVVLIAALTLVGLNLTNARGGDTVLLKGNHPPEAVTLRSIGEYNQRFGPRQADLDAVSEWLRSEGFTVEPVSNGALKFSGTVAQAEHAFSTRIELFGNGTTYANVDDPSIPARFDCVIAAVLGLDN